MKHVVPFELPLHQLVLRVQVGDLVEQRLLDQLELVHDFVDLLAAVFTDGLLGLFHAHELFLDDLLEVIQVVRLLLETAQLPGLVQLVRLEVKSLELADLLEYDQSTVVLLVDFVKRLEVSTMHRVDVLELLEQLVDVLFGHLLEVFELLRELHHASVSRDDLLDLLFLFLRSLHDLLELLALFFELLLDFDYSVFEAIDFNALVLQLVCGLDDDLADLLQQHLLQSSTGLGLAIWERISACDGSHCVLIVVH